MCCCAGRRPPDETRAPVGSSRALAGLGAGGRDRPGHGVDAAAGAEHGHAASGRGARAMSIGFCAVQWNRRKLVYDAILIAGVVLYIGAHLAIAYRLDPPKDQPAAIDIWIRAFGTCAFLM